MLWGPSHSGSLSQVPLVLGLEKVPSAPGLQGGARERQGGPVVRGWGKGYPDSCQLPFHQPLLSEPLPALTFPNIWRPSPRFLGLRGRPCSHLATRSYRHGATSARQVSPLSPAPLLSTRSFSVPSCRLNGALGGDEVSAYVWSLSALPARLARVRRSGSQGNIILITTANTRPRSSPTALLCTLQCVTPLGFLLPIVRADTDGELGSYLG